jgi:chemotaxis protein MotB
MGQKTLFSLLFLMAFMFAACVSKNQYVEVQNQLSATQSQLEAEQKQLADLQVKYQKSQNTNMSLLNTIEDLKFELRQEKTAVTEKEQNISQLDLLKRQTEADLKEQLAEKEAEIAELTRTRREIEESLKEQIEQRDIKIEEIEGKLKVIFVDKILFSSGSVMVKAKGREVLLKLADSFRDDKDQSIVVEGHTDDIQIGKSLQSRFPSNWELSTARAAAVVRFLQDKAGIEPKRLTASGFGSYQPVASNETEEERSQNRRIEIILAPPR